MKNKKYLLIILLLSIFALLPLKVKAIGNGQFDIYCEDKAVRRGVKTKCHLLLRFANIDPTANPLPFNEKDMILFNAAVANSSKGADIEGPGTSYPTTASASTIYSNIYSTDKGHNITENREINTLFGSVGYTATDGDKCSSTSLAGCFEFAFPNPISSTTPLTQLKFIKDLVEAEELDRRRGDVTHDKVSIGYIEVGIDTENLYNQNCAHLCVELTAYQKNSSDVYSLVDITGGTPVCADIVLKQVCRIVRLDDEILYYGEDGEEVTEDEFKEQCGLPNPVCRFEDGHYYDDEGEEVEKEEYEEKCLCRIDEDGKYYDHTGEEVEPEKWAEECLCRIQDGKYFDDEGKQVDEKTWKAKCEKKCYYDEENEIYYGKDGEEITKEQFEKDCIPPTGSFASYAVLIAGALIALSAITIAKKHNRFYRV